MDDYSTRLYNPGPGWWSVLFISLLTSSAVVAVFYGALLQGWLPSALQPPQRSEAAVVAPAQDALVKVPALLGLPATVAGELLGARGLRLVVSERKPSDTVPAEAVVAQQPLAESMLEREMPVSVIVSTGKPDGANVPELAGKPLAEAQKLIEAAGLALGPVAGPDTGVVKSSDPAAGKSLAPGGMVGLVLEVAGVPVPKLVGLSWGRAKALIEQSGFKLGKVRERSDDDRDAWVVLDQTPAAGAVAAPGSTIDVVRNESY
jgi:beta-lactam-binding protein with PASTA domain